MNSVLSRLNPWSRSSLAAIALIISSFWTLTCAAQDEKPWQLPAALRPFLEARVSEFIDAQAGGRWDQVALLLGDYRRGSRYLRYTPAHKACLITQMQAAPMIAFTFTVKESPFSSEIFTTPPERRWWTLAGEGIFLVGNDMVKRATLVIAYRDRNEWYFTPSTYFSDQAWARTHLTAEEMAADHKDQVDLLVPPDCPLELVDLHVFIEPENISSRHIQFQLHNKSSERVTAYSFKIGDERGDGSISVGTGAPRDAIEPGGLSRKWEADHSAYTYWCEGEPKMRIEIEDVTFANGTNWRAPRFSMSEKAR